MSLVLLRAMDAKHFRQSLLLLAQHSLPTGWMKNRGRSALRGRVTGRAVSVTGSDLRYALLHRFGRTLFTRGCIS